MHRRNFIVLFGGLAAAWPLSAMAQRPDPRPRAKVGILNFFDARYLRVTEITEALRELGYVEGQNLVTFHRWADGQLNRLPQLAAELVANKVDVIIALGPATWAAKRATTTIPIVTTFSGDPVGLGLVSSLGRPGANITGFSYMSTDLVAKRLELLHELLPAHSHLAALYHPGEPAAKLEMAGAETTARTIGVKLQGLEATQPNDLDLAFASAARDGVGGIIVFTHGFAELYRRNIIEAAARHRIPTMYGWRDFAEDGGLVSYGPNMQTMIKNAAGYADRIMRGERPGDLPMQQPARFELVVNLKTAKYLGLALPQSIMVRADEVME